MTQPKRPYERPLLEATEAFGVEAAVGTCCRAGACTNTTRDTKRTTVDVNKGRRSTAS